MTEDNCPHLHTAVRTSNSGDGTSSYDFATVYCEDCGDDLGDAE